jgi:hypothetical protein
VTTADEAGGAQDASCWLRPTRAMIWAGCGWDASACCARPARRSCVRPEDGGPDDGWVGRDPVCRPRCMTGRTMARAGRAGPHGVGESSIWRRRGWHRELQQERTTPGATTGGDGAESGGAGCRGGLVA